MSEKQRPVIDERQLRERAARRWRWRLVIPGAVGGLSGPLLGNALFHQHHHDGSTLAGLAGALVGVLVVLGLAALIYRCKPRVLSGDGWFSAPLSMGVRRKQRRAAARAVRRGTPSSDPMTRLVEQDLAHRAVRQRRRSTAFFSIAVLAAGLFAMLGNLTTLGHIYFGMAAVFAAALALWSAFFARQAKTYLASNK